MDPTTSAAPQGKKSALLTAILVLLLVLTVVLEVKRREAVSRVDQLSVQLEQIQKGTRANREAAQQVIEKVRKHIAIPLEPAPTVATIVNAESLKSRNPFYEKAENGDHLVITANRAVLYDPDADIILDVIPVQLQPSPSSPPSPAPSS